MGLFALLVADGREWAFQRAMGQPSYSGECLPEVLFSSYRASYEEYGANLGFSSWPCTEGSQAGLDRVAEHMEGLWHDILLAGLSFPIPQFFLLEHPILLSCSPSPPSTLFPVANASLSLPPSP